VDVGGTERARGNPACLDTTESVAPNPSAAPLDEENQKLRRENQHLGEELRKAEIVIDIQENSGCSVGAPAGARRTGSHNSEEEDRWTRTFQTRNNTERPTPEGPK